MGPQSIPDYPVCLRPAQRHDPSDAVNLGIDLCAALTLSRKAGYLYQNLKPDNIFVTSQRQFQLGDFGFLPLEDLPYATFPAKYRGPFAAPELFDDLER